MCMCIHLCIYVYANPPRLVLVLPVQSFRLQVKHLDLAQVVVFVVLIMLKNNRVHSNENMISIPIPVLMRVLILI